MWLVAFGVLHGVDLCTVRQALAYLSLGPQGGPE